MKIAIASCRRKWYRNGVWWAAYARLYFCTQRCKFVVLYDEWSGTLHRKANQEIPDYCTVHWLHHYTRAEGHLELGSWFRSVESDAHWLHVMEQICVNKV